MNMRDPLRCGGGWPLSSSLVAGRSLVRDDDDAGAAGFDAYIQSGTCAQPSDDFVVDLESEDTAYDVEPYVAVGETASRSPSVTTALRRPGFGLAAIYTDQQFSMVISDPDTDDAVACGDILRPDADRFGEAGLAVVQLLPVGSRTSKGSRPSSGPLSSASSTSRRPGVGSPPPTPSACRTKRQGTRATSRAGGASRRPEMFGSS